MNIDKSRWKKLAGINEIKLVKNKYLKQDENGIYIDKNEALKYLSQFDDEEDEISARVFIKDDEGWGEFESNIEGNMLEISENQLEEMMKEAMSFYFYSDGDSI